MLMIRAGFSATSHDDHPKVVSRGDKSPHLLFYSLSLQISALSAAATAVIINHQKTLI